MRSISSALLAMVSSLGLLGAGAGAASAKAVDNEPPVINFGSAVSYRVGTTLSSSRPDATIPVTIGWRQFDDDGICDRDNAYLYREPHGYSYPYIAPSRLTYSFSAGPGQALLGFRTYDCVGNETGSDKYDYLYLNQQAAFRYSAGWLTQGCTRCSDGDSVRSTRARAWATYTFDGDSVALVSVYGPGRGIMDVYVDGKREKSVDLSRFRTTYRVVAFQRQWGTYARHQIKVVARTAARVEIDAVLTN